MGLCASGMGRSSTVVAVTTHRNKKTRLARSLSFDRAMNLRSAVQEEEERALIKAVRDAGAHTLTGDNRRLQSSFVKRLNDEEPQTARHITTMSLAYNNLTSLPFDTRDLWLNLLRLNLSFNTKLFQFDGLRQLPNLRELNLSSTSLMRVPVEICSLHHLETLDLSRNHLRKLPRDLSGLARLTTLNLSRNSFATVPRNMAQLKALSHLDFSFNRFRHFAVGPPSRQTALLRDVASRQWTSEQRRLQHFVEGPVHHLRGGGSPRSRSRPSSTSSRIVCGQGDGSLSLVSARFAVSRQSSRSALSVRAGRNDIEEEVAIVELAESPVTPHPPNSAGTPLQPQPPGSHPPRKAKGVDVASLQGNRLRLRRVRRTRGSDSSPQERNNSTSTTSKAEPNAPRVTARQNTASRSGGSPPLPPRRRVRRQGSASQPSSPSAPGSTPTTHTPPHRVSGTTVSVQSVAKSSSSRATQATPNDTVEDTDLSHTRKSATSSKSLGLADDEDEDDVHDCLPSRLTVLDVSNNQLVLVGRGIGDLTSLRVLNLSFNRLSALPEEVAALQHLEHIDACFNCLEEFPPQLMQMHSLRHISLQNNKLRELPPEWSPLPKLERLLLSSNRIAAIPTNLADLKSLEVLNLSVNLLVAVPDSLFSMAGLKVLDISFNDLETISEKLSWLSSLEDLRLQGNPRLETTFPREILASSPQDIRHYAAASKHKRRVMAANLRVMRADQFSDLGPHQMNQMNQPTLRAKSLSTKHHTFGVAIMGSVS